MKLGIDPKVDYAFKRLFGDEKNTAPLIDLLNAVLNPPPEERIVEVEILNPFTNKMALDEKLSILDVKARDQLGRQFNAEMQMLSTTGFRPRILYYWGKLYTDQLPAGGDYATLRPTISVCFVDRVLFRTRPEHHLRFRLVDTKAGVSLTDHLDIHLLELPKFRLDAKELATPLDDWLYFLRYAEDLDPAALPDPLDTSEIRQAVEVLMQLAQIDIDKEIYEGRLKARRDQRMWEMAADEARAQALVEGRAEGLVEGRTEGLARGALLGRIELAQKALRHALTPRAELEAMPLEALEALAAKLERELLQ